MLTLDDLKISLLSVLLFALILRNLKRTRTTAAKTEPSIAIVVLGDIGRSPRMLYHAQSLVRSGFRTHIIAYQGSKPPRDLMDSPLVHFVYLPTPMAFVGGLPRPLFIAFAPLKVVASALALLWALLFRIPVSPKFILVQNPPAINTLPIIKFARWFLESKVIIDWHNTGYSVLALRLGETSPVVKLAKWIETFFGRSAYAHLCVTEAMRTKLLKEAKLKGTVVVFHDRPPSHFCRQSPSESASLLSRLPVFSAPDIKAFLMPSSSHDSKPGLLVSATSWTPDEDFSILLRALDLYEDASKFSLKAEASSLPKILMVITGKGADKAAFESQVEKREKVWERVRVRTAWLELEDYPKLLGSADLGISLHTSSSAADLPMKVVDMFGCGLPVCAMDFACVSELVQDKVNGRTFKTSNQLAAQLVELLSPSPDSGPSQLELLAKGIKGNTRYASEEWCTWEENWDKVVGPLVKKA